MNLDEIFKDMSAGKMQGKGNYMGEGQYLVRAKVLKNHEGHHGKKFIFAFDIVESTNDAHKPGTTGDYVVTLDAPKPEKRAYAWSDTKSVFFALAMKLDPKSVPAQESDPELHQACAFLWKASVDTTGKSAEDLGVKQDFLLGRLVRLTVTKRPTRGQNGGPPGVFSYHDWAPVLDQPAWDEEPAKAA
jgi:hypothetical protein